MSYSLTINAAGTAKDNERSRNINALFPFGGGTYRTISLITRRGGVWCNCGGTAQNVVLSVYDQLLDGSEVIKVSNTVTCKCYGTGPTVDNYALTSFLNWTQAESNAAIAAWEAGTLTIRRTAVIKSFTSPNHGTPVFRDGQYTDDINIVGETVPFTNYGPNISQFVVARKDGNGAEKPDGTAVYATIELAMVDASGLDDNARLFVRYDVNRDPDEESPTVDLVERFGLAPEALGDVRTVLLAEECSAGADYYFALCFGAGEELDTAKAVVPRASVPLFIAENNNGVAIGQYSSATEEEPKLESNWPAYFYAGVAQIGNGWTELEPSLASGVTTPGSYGGGALRCRQIEKKRIIAGSVKITPGSDAITIATLPDGYAPPSAVFFFTTCDGTRIARLFVVGKSLRLSWVRNLADGSLVTSETWVQCTLEYWVD